ncbi:MAG: 50S ribosomal protein L10 [Chloroflexota bacterium]
MITKKQKTEIVADLVARLERSSAIYLLDFSSMNVEDTIAMRRAFKKEGIDYKVAKNTLIDLAMKQVGGYTIPEDKLFGATGIAFGADDPVTPARIIKKISEKTERPKLKAASLEGQYFDGSQLKTIAALPSRADLVAGILGSLNAPISGIVGAINAVMRDVASLVEEVAKKQNAA